MGARRPNRPWKGSLMNTTARRGNVLTLDRLRLALVRNRSAAQRPEAADEMTSESFDDQLRRDLTSLR